MMVKASKSQRETFYLFTMDYNPSLKNAKYNKNISYFYLSNSSYEKSMNEEDLNSWLIDNFDKNILFVFEILSIFYFCT